MSYKVLSLSWTLLAVIQRKHDSFDVFFSCRVYIIITILFDKVCDVQLYTQNMLIQCCWYIGSHIVVVCKVSYIENNLAIYTNSVPNYINSFNTVDIIIEPHTLALYVI